VRGAVRGELFLAAMLAPVALATVAQPVDAGVPMQALPLPYGRWTMQDHEIFTARGRPYKIFDIARCGRGLCGVSVGDDGKCGIVLFRLARLPADWSNGLFSRVKWGNGQQDIGIYDMSGAVWRRGTALQVVVGKRADFGSRSGSMPKLDANYRLTGAARCVAR
jgi:hypothetical protein